MAKCAKVPQIKKENFFCWVIVVFVVLGRDVFRLVVIAPTPLWNYGVQELAVLTWYTKHTRCCCSCCCCSAEVSAKVPPAAYLFTYNKNNFEDIFTLLN